MQKKPMLTENYSIKCIHQKKISKINHISFGNQKKKNKLNPKEARRKEIRLRAEINETENSKSIGKKSMKPKAGSLKRSIKLISLNPG